MRANHRTFSVAEIVPASTLAPLDFANIFARAAPLEVDLGCGDGSFLVALAQQNPERIFLGIERMPGRVRGAGRKIGQSELANARVLRFDLLDAVQQLFARESVDTFWLMFPDPWPKRRHWNRRVFTVSFLRAISRALAVEGELRISTDHAEYFQAMLEVAAQVSRLSRVDEANRIALTTTFEERFRERGLKIYRLVLRKGSDSQRSR